MSITAVEIFAAKTAASPLVTSAAAAPGQGFFSRMQQGAGNLVSGAKAKITDIRENRQAASDAAHGGTHAAARAAGDWRGYVPNVGPARGAMLGSVLGGLYGAINPGKDSDGDERGVLSGAASGAMRGTVVGGLAGVAAKHLVTKPLAQTYGPEAVNASILKRRTDSAAADATKQVRPEAVGPVTQPTVGVDVANKTVVGKDVQGLRTEPSAAAASPVTGAGPIGRNTSFQPVTRDRNGRLVDVSAIASGAAPAL